MSNLIVKRDFISYKNILMSVVFLTMTVLVSSVKAEDLTVYSNFGELWGGPRVKGGDDGRGYYRFRSSKLSFTENGAIIGDSYLVSFVVGYDKATHKDRREYFAVANLTDGSIWIKGLVKVPHKAVIVPPDYKFTGVIVGGTKGYEHISGTYESQLAPDGKAVVTVYHIVRPE